ncbi:MAG TPA: PH domain-containing protein [Microbacteriaceae bacterium]|nr:PH domain-containing protein [Microbacteriaceae bacterium]
MLETKSALTWTLLSETPIPDDVTAMLVPGEQAVSAYKTFRDSAVFTDRRLIVRDVQGITGKKVEIYSLPYSEIHMWSSQTAGTLDFNAEVQLWTRAGEIRVKIGKDVDIRKLDALIALHVLLSNERH